MLPWKSALWIIIVIIVIPNMSFVCMSQDGFYIFLFWKFNLYSDGSRGYISLPFYYTYHLLPSNEFYYTVISWFSCFYIPTAHQFWLLPLVWQFSLVNFGENLSLNKSKLMARQQRFNAGFLRQLKKEARLPAAPWQQGARCIKAKHARRYFYCFTVSSTDARIIRQRQGRCGVKQGCFSL